MSDLFGNHIVGLPMWRLKRVLLFKLLKHDHIFCGEVFMQFILFLRFKFFESLRFDYVPSFMNIYSFPVSIHEYIAIYLYIM